MTRNEWHSTTDVRRMLGWLSGRRLDPESVSTPAGESRIDNRQLRLFACCVTRRMVMTHGHDHIDLVEDAIDALDGAGDRWTAWVEWSRHHSEIGGYWCAAADIWSGVEALASANENDELRRRMMADALRDVAGDPFHGPEAGSECDPCCGRGRWSAGPGDEFECPDCGGEGRRWPGWAGGDVLAVAEACYRGRADDGTLDESAFLVLADACEEGGCGDEFLLESLRGNFWTPNGWVRRRSPRMRYRGYWALDLLARKRRHAETWEHPLYGRPPTSPLPRRRGRPRKKEG